MLQRVLQQRLVLAARHVDRPESLQVVGRKLGVEEPESALPQALDQEGEADLRGIGGAMEQRCDRLP